MRRFSSLQRCPKEHCSAKVLGFARLSFWQEPARSRRWVWSIGAMILTGESWSSGREILYFVGGRWMNVYGALVEWYWQGKTEVLGEKHYIAWVVGEWMCMEHWWNGTDRGSQGIGRKTCYSATLSTTNLTWASMLRDWWLTAWAMARPFWRLTVNKGCLH